MNLAGGRQRFAKRHAVAYAQAVDEDGHMLAQVALLIETVQGYATT